MNKGSLDNDYNFGGTDSAGRRKEGDVVAVIPRKRDHEISTLYGFSLIGIIKGFINLVGRHNRSGTVQPGNEVYAKFEITEPEECRGKILSIAKNTSVRPVSKKE